MRSASATIAGMSILPPSETVTLHFVLRSTGSFAAAGRPSVPIAPYTLVLVPAGLRHAFADASAGLELLEVTLPAA